MQQSANQNISDTDLVKGSIAGDARMQEALYQRYAGKMYAVCLRYSGNNDDAQDLLQEGFIKVFRNLDKFRNEGSFEGWLRRVFVNTSIEHYRRKVHLNSITENEEVRIEDPSVSVLDQLAERDIVQLVQELSPGYRAVFNLYVIEGYSHKEIGDMLHISEGTSKSQLARAKSLLQKKVAEYLGEKRK
ncbi:RNA polymerase sigma factor [Flavihumibacter petaseus]|uniref:Putative RNA polymerase ECF-type sigma factor n=1 Tax=Flavihumibacter petaseus NBRC 106054 TaxID=1220578 RepID=A0A0E9N2Y3_9BACT|nr:RNA polymerase sigma factor [Flavihumibacter petaseus]GAO44189.1 putative RNA polymerase ECF-type sigma factor [Flavihumibacter petaseus NBRC 106054]